jgi:hypothetical protein
MNQVKKTLLAVLGVATAVGYASLAMRHIFSPKQPPHFVLKLEPVVIEIPDYHSPWLRPGWKSCGTDEKALHEQDKKAKKVRP